MEPPRALYWCELMEHNGKWEQYVEDKLTIARLATSIQKRSGGITYRGQALVEAQEQILAKNLTAGAEAGDRIQQPELAALAIMTCAGNGCNERATMSCPWCHQIPYCSLEHRHLNFEPHGVITGRDEMK